MVRTRGLDRALGKVIGKALGRGVNRDSDKAPQRRRPTTSAHRKWGIAPVAEDVQHVDHAADRVHEQPEEPAADDVVPTAKGFPGRPHDTSVLIGYVYHVVVIVWNGEVFIFLNKLYFHMYLLLLLK